MPDTAINCHSFRYLLLMHDLPDIDFTQRFIFDESDVRGELVALERACRISRPSNFSVPTSKAAAAISSPSSCATGSG